MTSLAQIADPAWLNSLFNSNMEEFFNCFNDADALIEFARWRMEQSRKVDVPSIAQWHGRPQATFIIVTPDPDKAPIAKALEGQAKVFVHGRDEFYNESVWFNRGIKEALRLGTNWIVLMSDDLYEVSPIQKLSEHLSKLDNTEFDVVWIDPKFDYYHSYTAYLAERHPLESVLGPSHWKLDALFKKFKVETVIGSVNPIRKPLHYYYFHRMFPRTQKSETFNMSGDFVILSAEWCKKQGPEVLCELFSGWEDLDLSQRLRNAKSTTIDWRIGSSIGSTIKPGLDKALRETFNLTIFNQLLRDGKYAT